MSAVYLRDACPHTRIPDKDLEDSHGEARYLTCAFPVQNVLLVLLLEISLYPQRKPAEHETSFLVKKREEGNRSQCSKLL